jgi:pimeloyl-ACP methyl ester carboxylesterase
MEAREIAIRCIFRQTIWPRPERSFFKSELSHGEVVARLWVLTVAFSSTRGEGRSPYRNFTKFHYDDFARDAIALLDHLNISRVAVVGWSDGAITGLDLAMNYSSRIDRVFAHGANPQANMSIPGTDDPIINSETGSLVSDEDSHGVTYSTKGNLTKRASAPDPYSCENLSPAPGKCAAMEQGVENMWATEPTWGPKAFAKIKCPVWIVDGDHDEDIERNQADAMAAWIPYAGQLLLPQVSHFALLEDPKFFNFAVEYFLDMKYDGVLPYY